MSSISHVVPQQAAIGVLVEEGLTISELPSDVTSTWQLVTLATGRDHMQFRVELPITGEEVHVTYSREGLARLKTGLMGAALSASYFNWPPASSIRPTFCTVDTKDAGLRFTCPRSL